MRRRNRRGFPTFFPGLLLPVSRRLVIALSVSLGFSLVTVNRSLVIAPSEPWVWLPSGIDRPFRKLESGIAPSVPAGFLRRFHKSPRPLCSRSRKIRLSRDLPFPVSRRLAVAPSAPAGSSSRHCRKSMSGHCAVGLAGVRPP